MDLQNITGLEKPLQKLVEVVAEGIGEVSNAVFNFDSKKIKRVSEAEAEAEKTKIIKKAEGSSEAIEILRRAGKRFALEQYNKQINLENIIVKTRDELTGKKVSDEPVDKDWASRFMHIAQDVSREDMQKLLSKILAEEIKKPNTFSLKTLDFVKNLSKGDLILFKKIAIISSDGEIFITKNSAGEGFSNISYIEILKMIEVGFIQSSMTSVLIFKDVKHDKTLTFIFKNRIYKFSSSKDQSRIELPILMLTEIGKELVPLIEIETDDEKAISLYFEDLKKYLKTKMLEEFKKIKS